MELINRATAWKERLCKRKPVIIPACRMSPKSILSSNSGIRAEHENTFVSDRHQEKPLTLNPQFQTCELEFRE